MNALIFTPKQKRLSYSSSGEVLPLGIERLNGAMESSAKSGIEVVGLQIPIQINSQFPSKKVIGTAAHSASVFCCLAQTYNLVPMLDFRFRVALAKDILALPNVEPRWRSSPEGSIDPREWYSNEVAGIMERIMISLDDMAVHFPTMMIAIGIESPPDVCCEDGFWEKACFSRLSEYKIPKDLGALCLMFSGFTSPVHDAIIRDVRSKSPYPVVFAHAGSASTAGEEQIRSSISKGPVRTQSEAESLLAGGC